jgi:hypothetical protein
LCCAADAAATSSEKFLELVYCTEISNVTYIYTTFSKNWFPSTSVLRAFGNIPGNHFSITVKAVIAFAVMVSLLSHRNKNMSAVEKSGEYANALKPLRT